jgi:hypothetical protein
MTVYYLKNINIYMNPKYPIYIISKGRWESRLTIKSLEKMNVPYHIVVEPQEYEEYAKVIDPDKIYTLPFSNLGQGSIPARNWVWEHSEKQGDERHWILDDNIRDFFRLHKNQKIRVRTGACFRAIEDFVDRYENIYKAGMNYAMFAPKRQKRPPFYLNHRVYSCILLQNNIPFRWRGRYNEDTDLSIRILKAGHCTVLFNAFLAGKQATMTMKGGNTEELYEQTKKKDGRWEMAESLRQQHPDIVKIKWKWGRWQHSVDYSKLRHNKPILKEGVEIPKEFNNYGLELINLKEKNTDG